MRKTLASILLIFLVVTYAGSGFCQSAAVDYLCELGISFYRMGRYDDALLEFNKVFLLEPDNQTAKNYVGIIFSQEAKPVYVAPQIQVLPKEEPREQAIEKTFRHLAKEEFKEKIEQKPKISPEQVPSAQLSGEIQARVGATAEDTYWKRANWDLNEKNYRIRSSAALDRRENTFDPRIYDRFRVKVDTTKEEGLGFYTDITVDPWSFTGKSSKTTVTSAFGDTAEVELKYWSNSGYAINETINSNRLGNSFNLPEIKVDNGKIDAFAIKGAFSPTDTFSIPEMKIHSEFQPVRELRFDYKQDGLDLKIFPIAYENQALTFDDPLRLSNNRIWWEDSPWLHSWKPGIYNFGIATPDFTKGYWDNTLSFFTKDSEGQRLTALRGFSLEFSPQESTSISTSAATPKGLWQDYGEADNFLSATRIKHALAGNLKLGLSVTSRLGYNLEDSGDDKLDALNYVLGTDLAYEIINGIQLSAELASSQSKYDLTNADYETEARGNAYYVSLLGRFPLESIINAEYGYNGIQPKEQERFFTKFRIFASRMDDSFEESLSSYVETRDDEWWSRHIHFRQPFQHYYQGEGQLLSWDDINGTKIGNGIDIGRSTLGLRIESSLWDKKVENLLDVRNVHSTEGKFLENVARDEATVALNEKLTAKALGIYQRMPKTKGGIDPFIFNPRNRVYYLNSYIDDYTDPSLKTGSLGLEYEFFDWLALNGIWERTNDISLAYDNFPRGILESGERSLLSYEEGRIYRDVRNWLNNQQCFPKPPYPYYNIFKAGLRLNPMEKLQLYLDYTRNPFEKAGQVDDNMNHIGFEAAYLPTPKWALFFKYAYSRWQDLDSITQNFNEVSGHHNLFTEFMYRFSENEDLTFQYGEASRNPYMGGVLDIGWDPYGGSLRTIDTQHIFRLYYRRKF
jgi:hypothetical protein